MKVKKSAEYYLQRVKELSIQIRELRYHISKDMDYQTLIKFYQGPIGSKILKLGAFRSYHEKEVNNFRMKDWINYKINHT